MTVVSTGGQATSSTPERLRRSPEIRAILAGGGRTRGAFVDARVRVHEGAGARLAVVAGRRVGNAVARNRAKRRLRAAARASGIPAGTDVVLIARPGAVDAPFSELCREVATATQTRTGRRARRDG